VSNFLCLITLQNYNNKKYKNTPLWGYFSKNEKKFIQRAFLSFCHCGCGQRAWYLSEVEGTPKYDPQSLKLSVDLLPLVVKNSLTLEMTFFSPFTIHQINF